MKIKLMLVILIIGINFVSGQTERIPYISFSHSFNNKDFSQTNYPSLEVGYTKDDISYGLGFGYNLDDQSNGEYYWEAKVTPSYKIGILEASIILGVGSYLGDTSRFFEEIGVGVAYCSKHLEYGVSFADMDNATYITPSITYNF